MTNQRNDVKTSYLQTYQRVWRIPSGDSLKPLTTTCDHYQSRCKVKLPPSCRHKGTLLAFGNWWGRCPRRRTHLSTLSPAPVLWPGYTGVLVRTEVYPTSADYVLTPWRGHAHAYIGTATYSRPSAAHLQNSITF